MKFYQFNIFYGVPAFDVLLPVGISFYTFQTLSYTIDVYNGKTPVQNHLGIFAVYVSFFPQLVAGPVLRAIEVIPQLASRVDFSWFDISEGLKRILFGLFLKVVLADNIAPLVDTGFSMPVDYDIELKQKDFAIAAFN